MNIQDGLYIDLLKKCLTGSLYDESGWCMVDPDPKEAKSPLRRIQQRIYRAIVDLARKRSILMVYNTPMDPARREMGLDWPCIGYTMVGQKRLDNVQACAAEVLANNVPGDFMETGVWRGGTTIFMRALMKVHGAADRVVWAADSFEGMPRPVSPTDGADLHRENYLRVSLETVKANFARFGLLDDQVRFVKGWFHESLPTAPVKQLALLRLDGDMYSSTMDALTHLYHRVSPGGYVIVDDYHSWEPCKRAVGDFLGERGLEVEIREIDGSAVYWKVG